MKRFGQVFLARARKNLLSADLNFINTSCSAGPNTVELTCKLLLPWKPLNRR